jgi:hypothetical protein
MADEKDLSRQDNSEEISVHIDFYTDDKHLVTSQCPSCKKKFTHKLNYWQEDEELVFYPNMVALTICNECSKNGENITLVGNNKVWEPLTPPNDLKK